MPPFHMVIDDSQATPAINLWSSHVLGPMVIALPDSTFCLVIQLQNH